MYQPVYQSDRRAGTGKAAQVPTPAGIQPMRLEPLPEAVYQDKWFAIVFLLNLAALLYFALSKGIDFIKLKSSTIVNPSIDGEEVEEFKQIAVVFVGLMGIGIILAISWLRFLLSYSEDMIRISLWLNFGFTLGTAFATLIINPFVSLFIFFIAAVNLWYVICWYDVLRST